MIRSSGTCTSAGERTFEKGDSLDRARPRVLRWTTYVGGAKTTDGGDSPISYDDGQTGPTTCRGVGSTPNCGGGAINDARGHRLSHFRSFMRCISDRGGWPYAYDCGGVSPCSARSTEGLGLERARPWSIIFIGCSNGRTRTRFNKGP